MGNQITLTDEQLDKLIDARVSKALAREAAPAVEKAFSLARKDLSEHNPVIRALIALAARVGQPVSPDGHTPFEVALSEMIPSETPSLSDGSSED